MFGTPFSQFVKAQAQAIYSHQFYPGHWLVTRAFIGAEHAYGNSFEVPYAEQFYIGGANSIRAFAVRSIGTGKLSFRWNGQRLLRPNRYIQARTQCRIPVPLVGLPARCHIPRHGQRVALARDKQRPGAQLTAANFLDDIAVGTGLGLRFDMDVLVAESRLGNRKYMRLTTPAKQVITDMTSFKDSLTFHLAIGYPF